MQLAYPFHFDGRQRTATTSDAEHIRDLIEQTLFTAPGERVNRPNFGSGVMQLVFAAASAEVAATAEFLIRGALQQFLGDRIAVTGVEVEAVDATIYIAIDYIVVATGAGGRAELQQGASP